MGGPAPQWGAGVENRRHSADWPHHDLGPSQGPATRWRRKHRRRLGDLRGAGDTTRLEISAWLNRWKSASSDNAPTFWLPAPAGCD